MITFTVPTLPVAQPRQRHRVLTAGGRTFAQNYTPTTHPVNMFKTAVQLAAARAGVGSLEGPVGLKLVFVFPRPGRLVWKNRPMPRQRHTSKPDVDNLFKSCADALTGICAYKDDAKIAWAVIEKWYAAGDELPHVEVSIEELK